LPAGTEKLILGEFTTVNSRRLLVKESPIRLKGH
jgi:hypothetical protein